MQYIQIPISEYYNHGMQRSVDYHFVKGELAVIETTINPDRFREVYYYTIVIYMFHLGHEDK
jgi:hypothetical protein